MICGGDYLSLSFYTYNVCWGCQSSSAEEGRGDRSARPMSGTACHYWHGTRWPVCLHHTLENIQFILRSKQVACLSFQETTPFFLHRLQQLLEKVDLQHFKLHVSGRSRGVLATVVNSRYFARARVDQCGVYDDDSGRPWQLLRLARRLYLLNVHRPHSSFPASPAITLPKGRLLVVVGDFNCPYRKMQRARFLGRRMYVPTPAYLPPKTCCDGSAQGQHRSDNDYVLANLQHSPCFIPPHLELSSDHAPCGAMVCIPRTAWRR